jgi:SEC-C motif-containing protein
VTTATECPCGSGKPLAACCDPYITGKAPAPTAESLMRARYTAYATGRVDFVEKTHDPEKRGDFDRAASEKWAKDSQWHGLRINAVKDGGEGDDTGIVNFTARFSQGENHYEHREISTFRRSGGKWYFVDGVSPKPETFEKKGEEPGRNDPCHCGSGKKFKKCHGKA